MPRSTSTNFTIKPPTNNTSSYPTKHTTPIKHQKSTMDLLSKNTKSHNRLPDINKATSKLPHNIAKRTLKDPGGSKTRKLHVGASKTIVPGSAKNVSRQVSSMGSAAKNPPSARDYKANLDSIVQSIDAGFVNNYLESAFDPLKDKTKPKLSKDEKIKRKKKVRIRYITSKIEEMKKKRTFLTSWDAVVEQEPESPEPIIEDEPSINSEDERNNMLKDVIDTQERIRNGYSHLDNIRKMIRATGQNVNHHMDTVGDLKVDLQYMHQKGQNFDYWLQKGNFEYMKQFDQQLKPLKAKNKSNSLKQFWQPTQNRGIPIGENGKLAHVMENINRKANNKLNKDDKVHIVNTLLGINGSMKDFSENLEYKLKRAFKDKAGQKHGMNKAQMANYTKNLAFGKNSYDAIANDAKRFLSKAKSGL